MTTKHPELDIPELIDEEDMEEVSGSVSNEEGEGEYDMDMDMEENPIMAEFGDVLGKIMFTLFADEEGATIMSIIKGHKEALDQQNKILFKIAKSLEKLTS